MGDGIDFAEALLGMPGFKVTGVSELDHGEHVIDVEDARDGGLVSDVWCARGG